MLMETRSPLRPFDKYETVPWQVDALVDHLPELSGSIYCPRRSKARTMKRGTLVSR